MAALGCVCVCRSGQTELSGQNFNVSALTPVCTSYTDGGGRGEDTRITWRQLSVLKPDGMEIRIGVLFEGEAEGNHDGALVVIHGGVSGISVWMLHGKQGSLCL